MSSKPFRDAARHTVLSIGGAFGDLNRVSGAHIAAAAAHTR
ncbi:Uncharacterised protein [Mycobacterium tuberculosis]|uniref:Uncharacterized protein n=1 Tax=Mycobacterium tuberculosis TaxID=1773 RepID=A0A655AXD8_MYCTX|nr:Uncharacterised protein [Mycobacterium tuberculosis]CKS51231.1 Uncharacterised protein [Mycobacterium tuberculosis]CKS81683.1 Uncharacterised protein [Mycobacterium tuberculosis]CKU59170.1 Uncharacterised protein [Mycobacterium tuberculosis]CNL72039.1 Uncharacterised protein [Mycobacterium tuberculosis]